MCKYVAIMDAPISDSIAVLKITFMLTVAVVPIILNIALVYYLGIFNTRMRRDELYNKCEKKLLDSLEYAKNPDEIMAWSKVRDFLLEARVGCIKLEYITLAITVLSATSQWVIAFMQ